MKNYLAFVVCFGGVCVGADAEAIVDAGGSGSGWEHEVGELALMALQIVAGVIAILIPLVLTKLLGLVGLKSNAEIEALMNTVIKKSINIAEAWASQQAAKPAGKEKMQVAAAFVLDMMKQYKLPEIATAKIIDMIEAQLERNAAVEA
jgi:hypothetical protein